MEAVRERPTHEDDLVLPPPPAPFPVDVLEQHLGSRPAPTVSASHTATALHTTGDHQVSPPALNAALNLAKPKDHTTPDFSAVQASCVHALSLLIPDSPTTSSTPLPPLSFNDSQLAQALTELLEVSHDLEALSPRLPARAASAANEPEGTSADDLDRLSAQMETMQTLVQSRQEGSRTGRNGESLHPTVGLVREELAWARMDALSHAILELVSERRRNGQLVHGEASDYDVGEKPPAYTSDATKLPGYQAEPSTSRGNASLEKERTSMSSDRASGSISREKDMAELDNMTLAIERLQASSSRLDGQRSEARPVRSAAEVKARAERDKIRELDEIFRLIEKSNARRRDGTRVDADELEARRLARRRRYLEELLDQGEDTRLGGQDAAGSADREVNPDLARARELRDRDRFLQDLVGKSEGGRLDGQDYPETMADRLETRRRSMMDSLFDFSRSRRLRDQDSAPPTPKTTSVPDPTALVTINDFFREARHMPPDGQGQPIGPRTRSASSASEGAEEKKTGTLRKIAGLVRRRSAGLTLKGQASDLSTVSYIAEHQENLLAVQVMLHGVGVSLKDELILSTDGTIQPGCGVTEATVTSHRDPSLALRISLPTAVTVGQSVAFAQSDLHLEAKLAALPTAPSNAVNSLSTSLSHPLSATELRAIKPRSLCCTACDREVANMSRALRSEEQAEGSGFKDLPSEHWAEMLEVWMCHDDPAFTAQLSQRTNEGFWPSRETVLVGGSYLLIHPEEGKRSNLNVELTMTDSWAVLKCSCGETLGKKRGKEEKYGAGTLKFSKWAVALLRDDDEEEAVEPVRYPFAMFIMSDLLELVQAHATFRFVISDETTTSPRLLIWIFNPNVSITYRKVDGPPMPSPLRQPISARTPGKSPNRASSHSLKVAASPAPSVQTIKAAKVLYKVLEDGLSSDFVPGFGTTRGGQVEHASYPSEVIERLIDTLRESSMVYPAGRRTFLGLDNGFLERL